MSPESLRMAERVRAAVVRAAQVAYEDAALRGLCCEGAWEVAVSAMRQLDLSEVPTAPPTCPATVKAEAADRGDP